MKTYKRVDTYIATSQDFAKPILTHIRKLVHKACPEVTETIKWGFPNFDYKGLMCSMASFKQHCAMNFWKASLIEDKHGVFPAKESMGSLGKIINLDDLPSDKILIAYIRQAMLLNEKGIKAEKKPAGTKKDLVIPDYFKNALSKNKTAKETFQSFSYSHQKEYLEWITEAKTEATREKRITKTVEQLSESKSLNWKYS